MPTRERCSSVVYSSSTVTILATKTSVRKCVCASATWTVLLPSDTHRKHTSFFTSICDLFTDSPSYMKCSHSRIPLKNARSSSQQKLSKIETLRLAHNYIFALSQILTEGRPMEGSRLLHVLARGLSQATANLLASSLGLCPIHCQVQSYVRKYLSQCLLAQLSYSSFNIVTYRPIARQRLNIHVPANTQQ